MFSIYGLAGRVYSGPLEDLRRLKQPDAAQRVSAFGDVLQRFEMDEALPSRSAPARDAAQAYADTGQGPRHRVVVVAELMSRQVQVIAADTPLAQAWRQLEEAGHAQAPVVTASGQLVGLLHRQAMAPGPQLRDEALQAHWSQPASARMHSPVAAVEPQTDVRRAAAVLVATGLPGLPVVAGDSDGQASGAAAGAPLGFIARTDLLRALAQDPPIDLWA